jgi:membrane protease YdiL (CAAX protease family)
MTEYDPFAEEPPGEEPPPPRGHPRLAWCVIGIVVAAVVVLNQLRPAAGGRAGDSRVERGGRQLQGRYLVGTREAFRVSGEKVYREAAQTLDRGTFRQRLEFAVLANELAGPKEALEQLDELKKAAPAPGDEDERLWELLHRLFTAYNQRKLDPTDILSDDDRAELRSDLGWYGGLALAPEGGPDKQAREEVLASARNVAYGLVGGLLGGCFALLAGVIGLLVLLILLFNGTLLRRFVPHSPYGAIYAETFAVWLLLFIGVGLLGLLLPPSRSHLLAVSLLAFLSLAALAWPVWRGVPWARVRQDVGLFARRPVVEGLNGFVCYVTSLPLLALGFLITLGLLYLQRQGALGGMDPGGTPGHPIENWIGKDPWLKFQVIFAASVQAPIVEEIMFRGVLYRHLREATGLWRYGASVLLSGLVTGFLFAVVHPQGLVAVPVLMGLSLGFTLTREWRGSLLPSMVAHGLHNFLVILLLFALLG